CGVNLLLGTCLNCTYGDGKPVTCCGCEGPFDQLQPPQFFVIHHPPQATDMEMLQARENLMEIILAFLKEYDHIPLEEKCMALLLAEERFLILMKQTVANISTYTPEPSRRYNYEDDDDDEEYSIPLNKMPQILRSIALTPVSSIMEPKDSLIIGNEHLSTIPEKESDEVIKSSVEDLVLIPSEFEDTSEGDSEYDLPSCDDFSSINVPCDNSVTLSNPLFDSNNDFTSSDDESLSDEGVPEDNVKIYSNPLFEFDDEYISSDVNPLFDEVLEDIESEDSYVSKLDEPDLIVTPLSAFNKDECFDPGGDIDEIDAFLDIVVSSDFEDDY
ncbi:hypothetical protein Tco_0746757, partial [Tanacetum coccineum]